MINKNMKNEKTDQEKEIFSKLEDIENKIQQTHQQLQSIDQGILDMNNLNNALEELKDSEGKEILSPLGRGIFLKTKLTSEKLIVDVGNNNFVTKNIPETKKLILEQKEKLEKLREGVNKDLEKTNNNFIELFSKSQSKAQN